MGFGKQILLYGCTVLLPAFAAAQPLKPFPQHVVYAAGSIQPSHITPQQMDDSVRAFYNAWKAIYLHNDASPGEYYIRSGIKQKICVSEGQGYGMLVTALLAGYDTAARSVFDGLYLYYRAHPSAGDPYLMAWAQDAQFKNIDGTSATDGDMDIAYALLLAHVQWGSSGTVNYIQAARNMMQAIAAQEINRQTFSILLSDAVERDSKDDFDMRSSDFMPAHCKAFKKYSSDTLWDKITNNNYRLFTHLQQNYSPDAGLVPDFIQHINTKPVPARSNYLESIHDGAYNYNACRVPWRIATDYLVNGDERAKTFVQKINHWIQQTTNGVADNISAGYSLAGNDLKGRYFEALSFIAPFAVAAMADKQNQPWLNKLWDYMESFAIQDFDYYDNTVKLICLIILSGNYWAP